jgi:hypothetical protein
MIGGLRPHGFYIIMRNLRLHWLENLATFLNNLIFFQRRRALIVIVRQIREIPAVAIFPDLLYALFVR